MEIEKCVISLGFYPCYKGYQYLIYAVNLFCADPFVTRIYDKVATAFGANVHTVERNIHNMIVSWWEAGGRIPDVTERPQPCALIRYIAIDRELMALRKSNITPPDKSTDK